MWFNQLRTMISIHALRGEGDEIIVPIRNNAKIFQSTPSVGRATIQSPTHYFPNDKISIHALRGEGDSFAVAVVQ